MSKNEPYGIYEWYNHKSIIFSKEIKRMTIDIVKLDTDATEILKYIGKLEQLELYPFLSAFIVFESTIDQMMGKELKTKTRLFCEPPKDIQEIVEFYERKKALSFEITDAIKKRVGKI